jgi:invasion protein IalB
VTLVHLVNRDAPGVEVTAESRAYFRDRDLQARPILLSLWLRSVAEGKPMKFPASIAPALLFLLLTAPMASSGALAESNQSKPAAPIASQHVESINFEHWIVTCQDGAAGSVKTCAANLRVFGSDGKQAVANWQIGYNRDNDLVSVFQVSPSLTVKTKDKVSTGVWTKNGAEMKLGSSAARRLVYEGCTPQACEAVLPVDDKFIKDAAGAATTSVTVWTLDGSPLPMTFGSKGLDRAIAAVVARKAQ